MKFTEETIIDKLALTGLTIAPSQVCGSIRLVPVLRHNAPGDLRLTGRAYADNAAFVKLNGSWQDKGRVYASYVPHGLVLSWADDGNALAASSTQLGAADGKQCHFRTAKIRFMERMTKRESGNSLRLLALHLAMEGFLALYFGGPDVAWEEYSKRAIRQGLNPRWEYAFRGESVAGFENALRTFEIHQNQVGVLVFVADALASAFVVSHPDDYRALHRTLLADFFGDLIYQYALLYDTVMPFRVDINADSIHDLAGLRAAVSKVRQDWADFQLVMAGDLLGRSVRSHHVYQMGKFTLQRFMTDLDLALENHIGEAIVRDDGTLEYLKTFRLSAAQARRAHLLCQLAAANWNIDDASTALQTTRHDLVLRLENSGFGYLLSEPVRQAASKHHWQLRRKK